METVNPRLVDFVALENNPAWKFYQQEAVKRREKIKEELEDTGLNQDHARDLILKGELASMNWTTKILEFYKKDLEEENVRRTGLSDTPAGTSNAAGISIPEPD